MPLPNKFPVPNPPRNIELFVRLNTATLRTVTRAGLALILSVPVAQGQSTPKSCPTCGQSPPPGADLAWLGFRSTYADATAIDTSLRIPRNALFDRASSGLPLSDQSIQKMMTPNGSFNRLERIPVELADVVVIGQTFNGKSYLSNDRTTLYTELSLKINEVVSNRSSRSISVGQSIDIERQGGVVKLPSGKVLIRGSQVESQPRTQVQYAMLLKYVPAADVYTIVSGFELAGDHVYILESLSNAKAVPKGSPILTSGQRRLNEYGGTAEAFVGLLHSLVNGK